MLIIGIYPYLVPSTHWPSYRLIAWTPSDSRQKRLAADWILWLKWFIVWMGCINLLKNSKTPSCRDVKTTKTWRWIYLWTGCFDFRLSRFPFFGMASTPMSGRPLSVHCHTNGCLRLLRYKKKVVLLRHVSRFRSPCNYQKMLVKQWKVNDPWLVVVALQPK